MGAGTGLIAQATVHGNRQNTGFLLKLVLTVLTMCRIPWRKNRAVVLYRSHFWLCP